MLRSLILSGAFAVCGAIATNAATVVVFDDNFNADSAGISGFSTVTELKNWNVTQGNVDILGTGFACTGCIDLDGSFSPAPAVLVTKDTFEILADILYTVTLFFADGTEAEVLAADFGGETVFAALIGLTESVVLEVLSDADSESILSLTLFATPNNFGPYLDRVLITYEAEDIAPVPLPAGAPLLLAGLGAFGLLSRRRRS